MPFRLPFGFPYNYNYYRRPSPPFTPNRPINNNLNEKKTEPPCFDKPLEDSDYFFELFGLKLYFDDVLIICILFFLYNERVQDEELFLCLILLLLS